MIVLASTAVAAGACVYGRVVIERNRKKKRDARLAGEGKKPPGDASSEEESEAEDQRGERGW